MQQIKKAAWFRKRSVPIPSPIIRLYLHLGLNNTKYIMLNTKAKEAPRWRWFVYIFKFQKADIRLPFQGPKDGKDWMEGICLIDANEKPTFLK
jgi:hypothetical protein